MPNERTICVECGKCRDHLQYSRNWRFHFSFGNAFHTVFTCRCGRFSVHHSTFLIIGILHRDSNFVCSGCFYSISFNPIFACELRLEREWEKERERENCRMEMAGMLRPPTCWSHSICICIVETETKRAIMRIGQNSTLHSIFCCVLAHVYANRSYHNHYFRCNGLIRKLTALMELVCIHINLCFAEIF